VLIIRRSKLHYTASGIITLCRWPFGALSWPVTKKFVLIVAAFHYHLKSQMRSQSSFIPIAKVTHPYVLKYSKVIYIWVMRVIGCILPEFDIPRISSSHARLLFCLSFTSIYLRAHIKDLSIFFFYWVSLNINSRKDILV